MTRISADLIIGCVLAGGRSVRMGQDKALTKLAGRTLLERAALRLQPQVGRLILNANDHAPLHDTLGFPVVGDPIPGNAGPLAGILAALRYAERSGGATHVVTAAVDTPFFPDDLVARLSASLAGPADVALASSAGRLHPVFGLWPTATGDALEAWLRGAQRLSIRAWAGRCATQTVEFPFAGGVDPFFNVNTPEDLAEAERIASDRI